MEFKGKAGWQQQSTVSRCCCWPLHCFNCSSITLPTAVFCKDEWSNPIYCQIISKFISRNGLVCNSLHLFSSWRGWQLHCRPMTMTKHYSSHPSIIHYPLSNVHWLSSSSVKWQSVLGKFAKREQFVEILSVGRTIRAKLI